MTLRSSMLRQERKPLAAFMDASLFCRRATAPRTEAKSRASWGKIAKMRSPGTDFQL
jgi:hypothetical protein